MSRKWMEFAPNAGDWRELADRERAYCCLIFRTISGPDGEAWSDEEMLDSMFELINSGLVVIMVRHKKNGEILARIDFPVGDNMSEAAARLGVTAH